jgi:tRNA pseudouridine55 synthase
MYEKKYPVKQTISGVLVVDKPVGMTSHEVVEAVRRGTNIRRAGHTGTLDPRASGVLVVLIGPAVRLSEYVSASDKRYQAIIRLGTKTDSYDSDGVITNTSPVSVTMEQFKEKLKNFIGEIEQTPPPYSAVKIQGRRAYEMAREGEEVEIKPRMIHVYSLDVLEWNIPEVTVDVYCSSGTYIRSLAYDLGEQLGCGAMLAGLRRTQSGRFTLRDATPLRKLVEAFDNGTWYRYVIPAAESLSDWPSITLSNEQVEAIRHGHRISAGEGKPGEMVRGITEQGELVALLDYNTETKEFQPRKVFFT